MTMQNYVLNTREVYEIADEMGTEQAYNLLLLAGPSYFDGDYDEVMADLESRQEASK